MSKPSKGRLPSAAEKLAATFTKKKDIKNIAVVSVFPTGPSSCNCVLIMDRETGHLVIVNPGGDFPTIIGELKSLCQSANIGLNKVRLAYILITQAHTQMFLAAGQILDIGNGSGEIVLHENDMFLWENAELQAEEFDFGELLPPIRGDNGSHNEATSTPQESDSESNISTPKSQRQSRFPKPGRSFSQGEELSAGNIKIVCLHTPGVSPGAACFYFPQINIVCTGTTLLSQSVGRTSWMGIRSLDGTANPRTLRRSIDEVLVGWVPGDTRVIPGFGPLTSLRHEMQKNSHLQKLSSRWTAYDDSQEMRKKQEERERKLREDPYGDGLPF